MVTVALSDSSGLPFGSHAPVITEGAVSAVHTTGFSLSTWGGCRHFSGYLRARALHGLEISNAEEPEEPDGIVVLCTCDRGMEDGKVTVNQSSRKTFH